MPLANIRFTQGVTTPGFGIAMIGSVGTSVTAAAQPDVSITSYTWTWIDTPPGSAITPGLIASGNVPSIVFTPDVADCYLLELQTTDGTNTDTKQLCFGVVRVSGRIVPPFEARASSLNFGGTTLGWSAIMRTWLNFLDGLTPPTPPPVFYQTVRSPLGDQPQRGTLGFYSNGIEGTWGVAGGTNWIRFLAVDDSFGDSTTFYVDVIPPLGGGGFDTLLLVRDTLCQTLQFSGSLSGSGTHEIRLNATPSNWGLKIFDFADLDLSGFSGIIHVVADWPTSSIFTTINYVAGSKNIVLVWRSEGNLYARTFQVT